MVVQRTRQRGKDGDLRVLYGRREGPGVGWRDKRQVSKRPVARSGPFLFRLKTRFEIWRFLRFLEGRRAHPPRRPALRVVGPLTAVVEGPRQEDGGRAAPVASILPGVWVLGGACGPVA